MNSNSPTEHFVTLFDSNFLPMGMALHDSLMTYGRPFHLWILCMDELVEEQLKLISLPYVTPIPLGSVETRELLDIKKGRTRSEYCWTVTPFTFTSVFERDESIVRVTYLDADVFFFASPQTLLLELDESGKHVLLTEHAYAPEYSDMLNLSGRFCVQFLTFRRTTEAQEILRWWQQRCVEWCFARYEDGKFGDQKYLDIWPEIFGEEVHILRQTEKTLAPWNVKHFEEKLQGRLDPVFYHFHKVRILDPNRIRLYCNYKVGSDGFRLYISYLAALLGSFRRMREVSIPIPFIKDNLAFRTKLWQFVMRKCRIIHIN